MYAIEWTPNRIRWYFDDNLIITVNSGDVNDWKFKDKFFYIILNTAGGDFGNANHYSNDYIYIEKS